VSTYGSILKNVEIRFTHQVCHNSESEKKCMNFLENILNLNRESEKFDYRDETHLQVIITALKIFLG
jgi:hypothetical protein